MQQDNLFAIFTEPISNSRISYFIGGSVASIVYGEPRLTHDIDVVLYINKAQASKLINLFPEEQFYLPPLEVLENEIELGAKGHINLIHHETGFKCDIYFTGDDELQLWALDNINEIEFMGSKLRIAPIEYVIVKKLIYFREGNSHKHLNDIKGMLRESRDIINYEVLQNYLKKYNVIDLFNQYFNNIITQ